MSITKTLLAGVAGTVLVGSGAMASEPVQLSESQMDNVTAGFVFAQADISDIIAFTFLGNVRTDGVVRTSAFEEIKVRPSAPVFSLVERGSAYAELEASCTGGCGVSTIFPGGVFAGVSNFLN